MERTIALVALFAALIGVLGVIPSFTLAFGVPISAQTLGVMLCGTVLGSRKGVLAVLLFLALVAIGLPLLAGGRGGPGVFVAPSAGFLIGWPMAAFVTGLIVERWAGRLVVVATVASVVGGIGVMYVFGIIGLGLTLNKTLAEAAILSVAFVPGDLVKAVIAGAVTASLARTRPDSVLSRT